MKNRHFELLEPKNLWYTTSTFILFDHFPEEPVHFKHIPLPKHLTRIISKELQLDYVTVSVMCDLMALQMGLVWC